MKTQLHFKSPWGIREKALRICHDLEEWRDEEIKKGFMDKARRIQHVINKHLSWKS